MSAALYDSIARIARHAAAARAIASAGKVTEIFPADGEPPDHAVSVELRDSGLILPRVPVAVGALGFAAIPAVGELVIVVFLDGDTNAPVVVGRLYHPDLNPPRHADGQVVLALPPGSDDPKVKLQIVASEPSLLLTLPNDVAIECADQRTEVRVGELRVTLDGAGGGSAEVAAGSTKITLAKDGDITFTTGGTMKIDAAVVDIGGSTKVKIAGTEVEIN
jgi:phage baseplate assembly protein gpV